MYLNRRYDAVAWEYEQPSTEGPAFGSSRKCATTVSRQMPTVACYYGVVWLFVVVLPQWLLHFYDLSSPVEPDILFCLMLYVSEDLLVTDRCVKQESFWRFLNWLL